MRGWRRGESLQQTFPVTANGVSQLQASPSVFFFSICFAFYFNSVGTCLVVLSQELIKQEG